MANITIIEELNGQEITSQDKDIEIERLKTTCFTLNNKVSVTEDVQQENAILRKRLSENEQIRQNMKAELDQYERTRQEYERTRVAELQAKNVLIDENRKLRIDLEICITQKSKLQIELEQATEYIIGMEEKVYKSNKISLELLKQLKDAEVEISSLQQYIIDLK